MTHDVSLVGFKMQIKNWLHLSQFVIRTHLETEALYLMKMAKQDSNKSEIQRGTGEKTLLRYSLTYVIISYFASKT